MGQTFVCIVHILFTYINCIICEQFIKCTRQTQITAGIASVVSICGAKKI